MVGNKTGLPVSMEGTVGSGETPMLPIEKLLDTKGKMRSRSLFREFQHEDTVKYPYYFNLSEFDRPDSISLKALYIQMADVTEYKFAKYVFHSFPFWEALTKTAWFSPYVEEWRHELKQKLASEQLAKVRTKAQQGDLNAMKYLHDLVTDKPKRGRPGTRPVRQITPSEADLNADYDRLISEDE